MAVEDAAVLAECLSRVQSPSDISRLVDAYQAIRKPRAEIVQSGSRRNGSHWMMNDGPEQLARDEMYRELFERVKDSTPKQRPKPDPEAHYPAPAFNEWLYHHDVFQTVS